MPEDGDGGVVRNTGMGTQLTGQASLQLLWDNADEISGSVFPPFI